MRNYDDCRLFIKFAYNRIVHFTIDYSTFEIIYDFNHLTALDLFSLCIDVRVSLDGNIKAQVIKALNENVR